MDISAISALDNRKELSGISFPESTSLTGTLTEKDRKAEGTLFDAFLNSAIDNIRTTNEYLSNAEDEEIKFALQYTVAVRDRLLDAYKELMQMQI